MIPVLCRLSRPRVLHAAFVAVIVASLLSQANPVHAQDKACIQSYEDVQVNRRASQLVAARDAAVRCASGCPASLAKDCAQWISELESSIPRVVFEARDGNGVSLVDVAVSIDGKPAVTQLQGRTIEVDPGPHTFMFATKGATNVSLQAVVVESQKNQRVSAQFSDYFLSTRSAPIPRVTWVFAGVSAVALGSAAVLGSMALSQRQDLEKQDCAPDCPGQEVARLSRLTTFTDVCLGIGVTALAGAVAVWFVSRPPAAANKGNELSLVARPKFYAVGTPGGVQLGARVLW